MGHCFHIIVSQMVWIFHVDILLVVSLWGTAPWDRVCKTALLRKEETVSLVLPIGHTDGIYTAKQNPTLITVTVASLTCKPSNVSWFFKESDIDLKDSHL